MPSPPFKPETRRWRRIIDLGHRWLGLLVFGQVLLWSLGGCLMYALDFSDLYAEPPPRPLSLSGNGLSPQQLQQRLQAIAPASRLTGVEIKSLAGELVYHLKRSDGPPILLNATGQRIDPIPAATVRAVAQAGYTGQGHIQSIERLPRSAGNYMSASPIWRVRFDDAQQTEIYIDPGTGALLARRKALWVLYNQAWEFHLMKYTPWPAANKALLLIFAGLNALVALTGLVKFFRWGYRLKQANEGAV